MTRRVKLLNMYQFNFLCAYLNQIGNQMGFHRAIIISVDHTCGHTPINQACLRVICHAIKT